MWLWSEGQNVKYHLDLIFRETQTTLYLKPKKEWRVSGGWLIRYDRCQCPSYHCVDIHAAAVSQHVRAWASIAAPLQLTNPSARIAWIDSFCRRFDKGLKRCTVDCSNLEQCCFACRKIQLSTDQGESGWTMFLTEYTLKWYSLYNLTRHISRILMKPWNKGSVCKVREVKDAALLPNSFIAVIVFYQFSGIVIPTFCLFLRGWCQKVEYSLHLIDGGWKRKVHAILHFILVWCFHF